MRKLSLIELSKVEAKGKNRDCMLMGGLATLAGMFGRADAVVGVVFGAIAYGCFDNY